MVRQISERLCRQCRCGRLEWKNDVHTTATAHMTNVALNSCTIIIFMQSFVECCSSLIQFVRPILLAVVGSTGAVALHDTRKMFAIFSSLYLPMKGTPFRCWWLLKNRWPHPWCRRHCLDARPAGDCSRSHGFGMHSHSKKGAPLGCHNRKIS